MSRLKVPCIGILFLLLCYFLNPMNTIMEDQLREGGFKIFGTIPHLLAVVARFVLITLAIGLPGLFLGPSWGKHAFLKVGLFFALLSSAVCVLHFIVFEKAELERTYWFIVILPYLLIYFLLGFASGGLWGFLGNRIPRRV